MRVASATGARASSESRRSSCRGLPHLTSDRTTATAATTTFDKNVGTVDRIFRLASGVGLVGAGWYFGLPAWGSFAMTVFGLMRTATGAQISRRIRVPAQAACEIVRSGGG